VPATPHETHRSGNDDCGGEYQTFRDAAGQPVSIADETAFPFANQSGGGICVSNARNFAFPDGHAH
jgi:prepilin-type processing-associated H-X9-DG protein